MKRVLGFLTAGILAVAPLSLAIADEHTPGAGNNAAEVHVDVDTAPVSADVAASVDVTREFTLSDESKFFVEGGKAYAVDEEGVKVPLADGEHKLLDGTVFEVKEGMATGLPPADQGAADSDTEMAPAPTHEDAAPAAVEPAGNSHEEPAAH